MKWLNSFHQARLYYANEKGSPKAAFFTVVVSSIVLLSAYSKISSDFVVFKFFLSFRLGSEQ